MTVKELQEKLEALGIPPDLYSLDGHTVYGITMYENPDGTWRVYILDERGNANGDVTYKTEAQACDRVMWEAEQVAKLIPEDILKKYRKSSE